jgi:hypothetical protein
MVSLANTSGISMMDSDHGPVVKCGGGQDTAVASVGFVALGGRTPQETLSTLPEGWRARETVGERARRNPSGVFCSFTARGAPGGIVRTILRASSAVAVSRTHRDAVDWHVRVSLGEPAGQAICMGARDLRWGLPLGARLDIEFFSLLGSHDGGSVVTLQSSRGLVAFTVEDVVDQRSVSLRSVEWARRAHFPGERLTGSIVVLGTRSGQAGVSVDLHYLVSTVGIRRLTATGARPLY